MATDNGLTEANAAFDRLINLPRETIVNALAISGNELANQQEAFAESSRDTGALIDSISVIMPGRSTPPYSQPGGSRVAGPLEVLVTVGDADVRYAHLVEYGTSKAEAKPYFWPAYRLLRKRLLDRINRAAKKAVKDAWDA